jgi:threonine synthase
MLTHLECARCGRTEHADKLTNLCQCGSPLLARYDLSAVAAHLTPSILRQRTERSIWRYRELLPVRSPENVISFGEGCTPLLRMQQLGDKSGLRHLYLKDEGRNPTGSFKARGAATGVSRAKELGVRTIAMPTNGNAGGAWATYGRKAGIPVVLCMPTDAPPLAVIEASVAGAHVTCVRGQISDAGAIIKKASATHGWFEAATLKEPYRIEGKKTMLLEILEDLDWRVPDVIVYPTGGGVGIIGIHKALVELQELGWIDGMLPRLIAVQAAGCAPIVAAFEGGTDHAEPWPNAETIAQGIRVPSALGDFMVLDATRQSHGTCVAVSDEQIVKALIDVGAEEGILVCPEGAAAVAAIPLLKASGHIRSDDIVVILNTGSGLKYPGAVSVSPPVINVGDLLPLAATH